MVQCTNRLPLIIGILLIITVHLVIGCSSRQVRDDFEIPPKRPASEFLRDDVAYPIDANDPFDYPDETITLPPETTTPLPETITINQTTTVTTTIEAGIFIGTFVLILATGLSVATIVQQRRRK